ncbi:MAG: NAD(P)-dependent oxidoreductase, partial [Rhodospirillaceae bacterium]
MENKMLQFVDVDRRMPEKRTAEDRRHDFDEIYRRFATDEAAQQSGRCSQCGVPF